jgi:hypothetical protein
LRDGQQQRGQARAFVSQIGPRLGQFGVEAHCFVDLTLDPNGEKVAQLTKLLIGAEPLLELPGLFRAKPHDLFDQDVTSCGLGSVDVLADLRLYAERLQDLRREALTSSTVFDNMGIILTSAACAVAEKFGIESRADRLLWGYWHAGADIRILAEVRRRRHGMSQEIGSSRSCS